MPHICFSESDQHWFRSWLVVYTAPSHYLTQCWVIANWTLRNKLQCVNQHTKRFIHKNASQYIVCEMAAILSRGRWVKSTDRISSLPTFKYETEELATGKPRNPDTRPRHQSIFFVFDYVQTGIFPGEALTFSDWWRWQVGSLGPADSSMGAEKVGSKLSRCLGEKGTLKLTFPL